MATNRSSLSNEASSDFSTIRISGLQKKLTWETYGSHPFTHTLRVPSATPIKELSTILCAELPGKLDGLAPLVG